LALGDLAFMEAFREVRLLDSALIRDKAPEHPTNDICSNMAVAIL
jgi:hypothetical protein